MARLLLGLLVALEGGAGCTGCPPPEPIPPGGSLRGRPLSTAAGGTASQSSSEPLLGPGALSCADSGVLCGEGCCPSGTGCTSDGGCEEVWTEAQCPPELPVACAAPPLDCAAGCRSSDESGRGNHLTLTAQAQRVYGWSGTAVRLVRSSCGPPVVSVSSADMPAGPITVQLWIRPGPVSSQAQTLFFQEPNRNFLMSSSYLQVNGCTGNINPPLQSEWRFVTATADSTATRLYLDGQLLATCPASAATGSTSGLTSLGSYPYASGSCYDFLGAIDEVRILDHVRSAGDIAQDADAGRLTAVAGTRALWRFDEGAPSRCCPLGSSCGDGGSCQTPSTTFTCPSTHPLACGARCCEQGAVCASGRCAFGPPLAPTCPSSHQACGDGTCCPQGQGCGASGCQVDAGAATAPQCGASEVPVGDGAGGLVCCWSAGVGVAYSSQGQCNGCYVPTQSCGSGCASGYACCSSESKCIRAASGAPACPGGAAPCGGGATPAVCCDAQATCASNGRCCPSGNACGGGPCAACGDGCCAAADCVAGVCTTNRVPAQCDGGVLCGGACCFGGCDGGACVEPASLPSTCGAGTPCGLGCCPLGAVCEPSGRCAYHGAPPSSCPAHLPVACANQSGCCKAGFACGSSVLSGQRVCRYVGARPVPSGPGGPRCQALAACEVGQQCVDGGCCPPGSAVTCQGQCCPSGSSCTLAGCACPDQRAPCGSRCCGSNAQCQNGVCVATCGSAEFPHACGEATCCGAQGACAEGRCVCGGDHPVECGADCCLRGGTCEGGTCICPAALRDCGRYCCGEKQQCLMCPGETELRCRDSACPLDCATGTHEENGRCVPNPGVACGTMTCAPGTLCVSQRNCIRGASGCSCSGSTSPHCVNFTQNGHPEVKACDFESASFNACCPGKVWVNGRCLTSC